MQFQSCNFFPQTISSDSQWNTAAILLESDIFLLVVGGRQNIQAGTVRKFT